MPSIEPIVIKVYPDSNRSSTQFSVDVEFPSGPIITHINNKLCRPGVAADWFRGRLQFLVYEDVTGDPLITVRYKDGKIAEIEIPRSLQKLIIYEEQESAWIKERDNAAVANRETPA
jgi:hypothetical protein